MDHYNINKGIWEVLSTVTREVLFVCTAAVVFLGQCMAAEKIFPLLKNNYIRNRKYAVLIFLWFFVICPLGATVVYLLWWHKKCLPFCLKDFWLELSDFCGE